MRGDAWRGGERRGEEGRGGEGTLTSLRRRAAQRTAAGMPPILASSGCERSVERRSASSGASTSSALSSRSQLSSSSSAESRGRIGGSVIEPEGIAWPSCARKPSMGVWLEMSTWEGRRREEKG